MAQIRQHKNATTTPALRRWIQENRHLPTAQIMREKGLSRNTVVRWKNRDNTDDASSKPQHPQTNGMVERFNGRIAQILKTTRFQSSQELAETLKNYLHSYNHLLPQKAIGYKPPVQALAQQLNQPNLKGMDIYAFFPGEKGL